MVVPLILGNSHLDFKPVSGERLRISGLGVEIGLRAAHNGGVRRNPWVLWIIWELF